MNILIVKLSSLGDVVHAMPAVQDIRRALPQAQIDWVVEPGFLPLVERCEGVRRVIPCSLRQWRKAPLSVATRQAWKQFKAVLWAEAYDAVIDLQGLTKSALIARLARLAPGGKRFALANRTDGSSYEAPTRWFADVAVPVTTHSHAVARSRELCAKALGYTWDPLHPGVAHFGLMALTSTAFSAIKGEAAPLPTLPAVAFVHGTSRADKQWPEAHWIALAHLLLQAGYGVALTHGNDAEFARSQRIAKGIAVPSSTGQAAVPSAAVSLVTNPVQLWPRLGLDALTDRLAHTAGVIGVDSGLSHIAVALNLPHVQLYNFDTAWRTGPTEPLNTPVRQCSVFALPHPRVEQVWQAWQRVSAA